MGNCDCLRMSDSSRNNQEEIMDRNFNLDKDNQQQKFNDEFLEDAKKQSEGQENEENPRVIRAGNYLNDEEEGGENARHSGLEREEEPQIPEDKVDDADQEPLARDLENASNDEEKVEASTNVEIIPARKKPENYSLKHPLKSSGIDNFKKGFQKKMRGLEGIHLNGNNTNANQDAREIQDAQ